MTQHGGERQRQPDERRHFWSLNTSHQITQQRAFQPFGTPTPEKVQWVTGWIAGQLRTRVRVICHRASLCRSMQLHKPAPECRRHVFRMRKRSFRVLMEEDASHERAAAAASSSSTAQIPKKSMPLSPKSACGGLGLLQLCSATYYCKLLTC